MKIRPYPTQAAKAMQEVAAASNKVHLHMVQYFLAPFCQRAVCLLRSREICRCTIPAYAMKDAYALADMFAISIAQLTYTSKTKRVCVQQCCIIRERHMSYVIRPVSMCWQKANENAVQTTAITCSILTCCYSTPLLEPLSASTVVCLAQRV